MDVVTLIGKENLQWLATEFGRETRLKDLPEEILAFVATSLGISPARVFGVATFYGGTSGPLAPKLRLVLTLGSEVQLP